MVFCYTGGLLYETRHVGCRATRERVMIDEVNEDKCTKRLIRRCISYNVQKPAQYGVFTRLQKLNHMCSRTVSVLANNFFERHGKKSSVVLFIFRLSPVSGLCVELSS